MDNARAIRLARRFMDRSQKQIAKETGIPPGSLAAFEAETRPTPDEVVDQVAKVLGVDRRTMELLGADPKALQRANSKTIRQLGLAMQDFLLASQGYREVRS